MPVRPIDNSQQDSSVGLSRLGGAASRGSTPIAPTLGGNGAAMLDKLLGRADDKTPSKSLSGGGPGRQFGNLASGGDPTKAAAKVKSVKAFSSRLTKDGKSPTANSGFKPTGSGADAFGKREGITAAPAKGTARVFASPPGPGLRRTKGF